MFLFQVTAINSLEQVHKVVIMNSSSTTETPSLRKTKNTKYETFSTEKTTNLDLEVTKNTPSSKQEHTRDIYMLSTTVTAKDVNEIEASFEDYFKDNHQEHSTVTDSTNQSTNFVIYRYETMDQQYVTETELGRNENIKQEREEHAEQERKEHMKQERDEHIEEEMEDHTGQEREELTEQEKEKQTEQEREEHTEQEREEHTEQEREEHTEQERDEHTEKETEEDSEQEREEHIEQEREKHTEQERKEYIEQERKKLIQQERDEHIEEEMEHHTDKQREEHTEQEREEYIEQESKDNTEEEREKHTEEERDEHTEHEREDKTQQQRIEQTELEKEVQAEQERKEHTEQEREENTKHEGEEHNEQERNDHTEEKTDTHTKQVWEEHLLNTNVTEEGNETSEEDYYKEFKEEISEDISESNVESELFSALGKTPESEENTTDEIVKQVENTNLFVNGQETQNIEEQKKISDIIDNTLNLSINNQKKAEEYNNVDVHTAFPEGFEFYSSENYDEILSENSFLAVPGFEMNQNDFDNILVKTNTTEENLTNENFINVEEVFDCSDNITCSEFYDDDGNDDDDAIYVTHNLFDDQSSLKLNETDTFYEESTNEYTFNDENLFEDDTDELRMTGPGYGNETDHHHTDNEDIFPESFDEGPDTDNITQLADTAQILSHEVKLRFY